MLRCDTILLNVFIINTYMNVIKNINQNFFKYKNKFDS